MVGNTYGLLGKIDDLEGNLWREYSYALEDYNDWEWSDYDDWELSDAAVLLIAWLVATHRCKMEDLEAGLKVFKKIADRAISAHNSDAEFGPDDFVRAVMYEATKEMAKEKTNS